MQISINRNALKAVSRFAAKSDVRFYLVGVFVEANETETRIVATDGHTMLIHREHADKDANTGAWSGIISMDTINQVLKVKMASKRMEYPVEINVQPGNPEIRIEYAGSIFVCKAIDGQYPDYRKVIPGTISGEPAIYNPEYLQRVKDAANDLNIVDYGVGYNGTDPGVFVINSDCFAIVMPLRYPVRNDASAIAWGKEPVRMPPKLEAVA